MSYDIRIVDKQNRASVYLKGDVPAGGTYCVSDSDTSEAWLNVTYNYYPIFEKLFGENGIRSIYGKDIAEIQQTLIDAAKQLKDDTDDDYWKCTEGNVKAALKNLIAIADAAMKEFPKTEMVWSGD